MNMRKQNDNKFIWNYTILRILLGAMMVSAGYSKLLDTAGVTGMLEKIGFFYPIVFAWVLLLSELIFGLMFVMGYKTKYACWPLAFILLVADATVIVGKVGFFSPTSFFHLIGAISFIMFFFGGPGKLALEKNRDYY